MAPKRINVLVYTGQYTINLSSFPFALPHNWALSKLTPSHRGNQKAPVPRPNLYGTA